MLQRYQTLPYENIISEEYFYLCNRSINGKTIYPLPSIVEVAKETGQTLFLQEKDNAIKEAIERKEHEIYGLSTREFFKLAYDGKLVGFELPVISTEDVSVATHLVLTNRHLSYINFDGELMNSPLGDDLW